MSYSSVAGHRSMALDAARNAAYARALAEVIGPSSVVLDVGAGTGIHGLIAAKLGARRVYLVEPEDVIAVAREVAEANGATDVVRCLKGRIEEIELPESVDVIVSALAGNFVVAEDLLPALFSARDRFLKPGGTLIPGAAVMEAVPVTAESAHGTYVSAWSVLQAGVDLSGLRRYAANTVFFDSAPLREAVCLAEPRIVHAIDFSRDRYDGVHATVTYDVTQSGICHGWAGWSRMRMGDDWLSTSPFAAPVHWTAAYLPLDPPLSLEAGDSVSFRIDREPHGDWTWAVETPRDQQRHSTLLSEPLDADSLLKARPDHLPSLSRDGEAVREVLSAFDGTRSAHDIADGLTMRFPGRFPSRREALAFVQRLVKRHA